MQFFMVRHCVYDGNGHTDVDDIIPCSTSEKGVQVLASYIDDDYVWETDDWGFRIVIKREGRYAYDYYYLESMTMDEEL